MNKPTLVVMAAGMGSRFGGCKQITPVDELRNLSLQFRGSSNQRLIDLNRTREAGKIILWEEK